MGENDNINEQQNIIIYRTADGNNYNVVFYSLEMIIAVGYRVRSRNRRASPPELLKALAPKEELQRVLRRVVGRKKS